MSIKHAYSENNFFNNNAYTNKKKPPNNLTKIPLTLSRNAYLHSLHLFLKILSMQAWSFSFKFTLRIFSWQTNQDTYTMVIAKTLDHLSPLHKRASPQGVCVLCFQLTENLTYNDVLIWKRNGKEKNSPRNQECSFVW